MYRRSALLVILLLFALGHSVRGHDKWLEAVPYQSKKPSSTKLYLLTGEAFQQSELLPIRSTGSVRSFQLISSVGSRELRGSLREDMQPIAIIPSALVRLGSSVLSLQTAATDIWLSAEKFQRYLFEERLFDILTLRWNRGQEDSPGLERYSRSLKTIIQVGERLDDVVLHPVGQDLEILPLVHPYGLRPGHSLSVKVLFHGKPLSGRAVTFANRYRANITTQIVRTDLNGNASMRIERAGEWLVALVHMEASTAPETDWRSYWSSLTFALSTENAGTPTP